MTILDLIASDKVVIAIAGFCGALVSGLASLTTFRRFIIHVIGGTLTAFWLAPIGMPLFGLGGETVPADSIASIGAFLIGSGGSTIAQYLFSVWELRVRKGDRNGNKS
ncbi:hypothetical protein [Martelella sp. HB161492]|uniref:hypothetical protein n=1 Tax=Martelella sp. HB161492 TaxID=2720726 RepID=UPI001592442F|nr:hypothetical protein [Martelella sp. HB161492]